MQDQIDPSMEQALAAIKRVMAEDKDHRKDAARATTSSAPVAAAAAASDADSVLELDQPMIEDLGLPMVDLDAPMIDVPYEDIGTPLVSEVTAEASRARLAELQQAAASAPEPPAINAFEQLVREMLRPMLKDWLDEHLPRVIEEHVKREIGRITGQRL
jgi:cell pole-organizing protein PopZ